MAKRGIKIKEGEDLSPSNIKRVINALESDTPITKKEACQMLKIAYNTARLGRIIQDFKDKETFSKIRKQQLRNEPVDKDDRKYIIQTYLSGTSISEIAEDIFRNPTVVKNILKQYNIPIRNRAYNYFSPVDLEPNEWGEEPYKKGDLVFSARYNQAAYVDKLESTSPIYGDVYRIWITGDHCRWAIQPSYELADLRKLQNDLGIKMHELDHNEIIQLINEGLLKAKKLKKVSND